jgi:hypothetical protein
MELDRETVAIDVASPLIERLVAAATPDPD